MNTRSRLAALACAVLCCRGQSSAAAGPVLHLAANTWQPYVGADLPGQGIASEIVLTALKRAGYAADIRFMPWSRALASAYSGSVDGVVGVWSTSQRRARLVYSDSYLSNALYLFYVRPELYRGGEFSTTPATRIGVGRDYDYSDAFLARYGSALEPVDRIKQNLLKLQLGRIELMLEDERAVEYTLRHDPGELSGLPAPKRAPVPLLSLPLHLGLSRACPDAEAIVGAFNVQLKAMRADGSLAAIMRRHAAARP